MDVAGSLADGARLLAGVLAESTAFAIASLAFDAAVPAAIRALLHVGSDVGWFFFSRRDGRGRVKKLEAEFARGKGKGM